MKYYKAKHHTPLETDISDGNINEYLAAQIARKTQHYPEAGVSICDIDLSHAKLTKKGMIAAIDYCHELSRSIPRTKFNINLSHNLATSDDMKEVQEYMKSLKPGAASNVVSRFEFNYMPFLGVRRIVNPILLRGDVDSMGKLEEEVLNFSYSKLDYATIIEDGEEYNLLKKILILGPRPDPKSLFGFGRDEEEVAITPEDPCHISACYKYDKFDSTDLPITCLFGGFVGNMVVITQEEYNKSVPQTSPSTAQTKKASKELEESKSH